MMNQQQIPKPWYTAKIGSATKLWTHYCYATSYPLRREKVYDLQRLVFVRPNFALYTESDIWILFLENTIVGGGRLELSRAPIFPQLWFFWFTGNTQNGCGCYWAGTFFWQCMENHGFPLFFYLS